jgi:tRNA (Thr-GGU) A37 N-methylase
MVRIKLDLAADKAPIDASHTSETQDEKQPRCRRSDLIQQEDRAKHLPAAMFRRIAGLERFSRICVIVWCQQPRAG